MTPFRSGVYGLDILGDEDTILRPELRAAGRRKSTRPTNFFRVYQNVKPDPAAAVR